MNLLGLGLGTQAPAYSTPGINPAAPDPLAGLGRAPSAPAATGLGVMAPRPVPANLDPLGMLGRQQAQAPAGGGLGLGVPPPARQAGAQGIDPFAAEIPFSQRTAGDRLGDFAASVLGGEGGSDARLRRVREAYQARQQQFRTGLQVLEAVRQGLDAQPLEKQAETREALRAELTALSPGFGSLFDATVGTGEKLSKYVLGEAENDEGLKALLATGASAGEIRDYIRSPEFQDRARARMDRNVLPSVLQSFERIATTDDPEIRGALARARRDGLTVEEVERINAMLPEGEGGYKLTAEQLEVARRRQGEIARALPGFGLVPTEQYQADQAAKQAARAAGLKRAAEVRAEREAGGGAGSKAGGQLVTLRGPDGRVETARRGSGRVDDLLAAGYVDVGASGEPGPSPRERADAQTTSQELVPGIAQAKAKIAKLERLKALHSKLFTGPIAGRVAELGTSDERQELNSLLAQVRVDAAPQGQGAVSNYERTLFNAGVPGAENDSAPAIYQRMIDEYRQAIADDEARLRQTESITGRPTPRGAQTQDRPATSAEEVRRMFREGRISREQARQYMRGMAQ